MAFKTATERLDPDAFVSHLKQLLASNIAGTVQLVTRINSLIKEAAKATTTEGAREAVDPSLVLSRWLDFNLAISSLVSKNTLATLNGIVSAAERIVVSGTTAPDVAENAAIDLHVVGRRGTVVAVPFMVENKYERNLEVTFKAEDLIPANGPVLPAAFVSFKPSRVNLGPKEEKVVRAVVQVTEDFLVDQTYTTQIEVLGFRARDVRLAISIVPSEEAEVERAREPKKRRSEGEKKKRKARKSRKKRT